MTVDKELAAVRAWAQAHARTVTTTGAPGGRAGGPGVAELAPRERLTLAAHEGWSWAVDAATGPDGGVLLASGGVDRMVRVWDPQSGQELRTLAGHSAEVDSVAFVRRADGSLMLASGSYDGTCRLWDPLTGEHLTTLTGHASRVWWVTSTTLVDGTVLLATGSDDNSIRLWNATTGAELRTLDGHGNTVASTAFLTLPDGSLLLASGGAGEPVRIWDPLTGDLRRTFDNDGESILSVGMTLLPDGSPMLAIGGNKTVWLADPVTGRQLGALSGHTKGVHGLAFATLPDGTPILATASYDSTCRLWTVPDGQSCHVLTDSHEINGATFLPGDGWQLTLATCCDEGRVHLYDLFPTEVDSVAAPSVRAPRPSRPDHWSRTALPHGWNMGTAVATRRLTGHTDEVHAIVSMPLPDGRRWLASSSSDRTVRIWDALTGEHLRTLVDHTDSVACLAFAVLPDGQPILASAGGHFSRENGDNAIRLWDPVTGQLHQRLEAHRASVFGLAFLVSPGRGPLLASGSYDRTFIVWDALTWRQRVVQELDGAVVAVASIVANDGDAAIVAGSRGRSLTIYNPRTDEMYGPIPTVNEVFSVDVAILPDGSPIAAAGLENHNVEVWNLAGQRLHTIAGHTHWASAVRFATLLDGTVLLLSASGDQTIGVSDPETGRRLHTFEAPGVLTRISPELAVPILEEDHLVVAVPSRNDVLMSTVELEPPAGWAYRAPTADTARPAAAVNAATTGLAALATGDVSPPLSLLADLVTVVGPAGDADSALAGLAEHPGVQRLRALQWPVAARVGLAAMLTEDLVVDPRYRAPGGSADELLAALRTALAEGAAGRPPAIPLTELLAAAERITDKTLTLLSILGPAAVAGDPLLPLRVRHLIPALPSWDSRRHAALLEAAFSGRRSLATGSTRLASPGTNGITRRGTLPNLLPPQLALPPGLFDMRYAQNELLYRLHDTAPPPAELQPVTLVLDTSPATFGVVETVLRSTAHVLALTLRTAGLAPALVTLDRPDRVTPLLHPADLLAVWTSRTLARPDLATALDTARAQPADTIIVLTQHRLPVDLGLVASAGLRLLTTHAPGDPPRRTGDNPYRVHLGPRAGEDEIIEAASRLLTPQRVRATR